jgi:glycosyltransferase involved in cell wall biosynthesis
MAEAMALGTPVIATGWSGNLDFMDEASALLTPYALIPVNDPQGFYQGQHWADADIAFAADRLLRLRYDVDFARRLSASAQDAVRTRLSPEVWFSRFPASLRRRILRSARRRDTIP